MGVISGVMREVYRERSHFKMQGIEMKFWSRYPAFCHSASSQFVFQLSFGLFRIEFDFILQYFTRFSF